jgi:hypothetical protein
MTANSEWERMWMLEDMAHIKGLMKTITNLRMVSPWAETQIQDLPDTKQE